MSNYMLTKKRTGEFTRLDLLRDVRMKKNGVVLTREDSCSMVRGPFKTRANAFKRFQVLPKAQRLKCLNKGLKIDEF